MSGIRVACSPLTGTIYAGRPNRASTAWAGEKHDVTSDVIGAIIEKIGAGHVITVNENGKPAYEIEVRRVPAGDSKGEQAPEDTSRDDEDWFFHPNDE